ncbi:MAG: 16S rRNA (cytosine(1402)-N(4))-methyltransferase RsmH [bacterium]|nr:16S rRNA (cytosine(1402)-N(4))-methyltransferase RsmH [bacterium]
MHSPHTPVLLDAVVTALDIQPNDCIVDGTLGFGGHAQALIQHLGPHGRYIGLDQDPAAIAYCKSLFESDIRVSLHQCNFRDVSTVLTNDQPVHKVLIDLGVSSYQLDHQTRGFSFQHPDAALDMRMDPTYGQPASVLLNTATVEALSDMFRQNADLDAPKLIQKIDAFRATRPFETTHDLVSVVKQSFYFNNLRRQYIAMVQRVFQAVRMAVNDELGAMHDFLYSIPSYMPSGAILAVICFHSGESKTLKRVLPNCLSPVQKKVIKPTYAERRKNSRSACAQLRIYAKL